MQDDQLLLAVPRRPLYGLSGMITRIDLAVLGAVSEEGWFATRAAIADDVDCKEVRLGVLVLRRLPEGVQVLVADGGRLLHLADVPAEVGCALSGLKRHAQTVAAAALPGVQPGVELAGYLNDDGIPDLRRVFLLVYRATVPPGTGAPAGTAWVSAGAAGRMQLDAVSRHGLAALG
jgi:hypothetical protein